MDELKLINEICKWVLIVCSLTLLYFGTLLILKLRKDKKWERQYKPSLQTMKEEEASSHATFVELKYRGKKYKKKDTEEQDQDGGGEEAHEKLS